ncbi:hypothetical protein HPB49_009416 [Dermacentor silvarum]|uniref:Uncharacterized protein n=1 Tax=Dermacentor silvarum TaxID=543639 RepID=A0ACB8DPD0_DERSI|nr:hypothetical protein HPB49_009416 [Dermacentor silvarum]
MAAMANGQSNNKAGANRVYFALKDDVAMLTEVQTSDPFRHSEQWEEIAWRLRDVLKKPFTVRCVRERLNLLLPRHLANDRRNQKKSGTEEEYTERDQLLQDILSLIQGTSYKVRSAKKSRKVCSGDSNVQAQKSAAAARDVHASRYAERSTVFIDECDTADDEFDIASPTGDVTPAQLLTRMVTADDDDGEREDDISESAMSIDRPVSTEPQSAAATHAVPSSGDTICAATLATAGYRSTEPPRDEPTHSQAPPSYPRRGKRQQEQADYDFLLKRMKHDVIMKEKDMQMESRRLAFEESKVAFEERRLAWEKEQAMMMAREREEDRRARAEERKEERRVRAEEKQEERRERAEERRLLAAQQEAFISILQGLLPKINMQ